MGLLYFVVVTANLLWVAFLIWGILAGVARLGAVSLTTLSLELHRTSEQTLAQLDDRYRDPDFDPRNDPAALASFQAFWLHVFLEWKATTRWNDGLHAAQWSSLYAPIAVSAIDNRPLRLALPELLADEGDPHLAGFRDPFRDALAEAYRQWRSREWPRLDEAEPPSDDREE